MSIKPKYSLLKLLFVGKDPIDRKHAPKIIEYFWLGVGNLITILITLILFIQYFSRENSGTNQKIFSDIFDIFWNKLMLAAFLGNVIGTICSGIRLLFIQKKTEEFKLLAKMCAIFSFGIVTAPIALCFTLICYKYNEIEFV